MARIAVLGLGRMGRGIAGRLVDAGHDLTVYNRTTSAASQLVAAGAHAADTPRAAAEGADVVLSMVADDEASRSVWLGPGGALAATLARDAVAVECSTLSREWVRELAARAINAGVGYVDAPVTGLPAAAAAGELTLLVGADATDLDRVSPVLDSLSTAVVHFGPVGAGTAYKLIVNLMGAVQIAGVAEAMVMAERAGLDLSLVADTIATGQAASPQVVRNARRMVAGNHDDEVVFSGRLRRKDTSYGVRLAAELGVAAPLGAVALDGLIRLGDLGRDEANESSIIEVARERSDGGNGDVDDR